MTSKRTTLIAYSIDLGVPKNCENVDEHVRLALTTLLDHAIRRITKGDPQDITLCNRVSLELEEEHWDQKFVFRLERIES